MTIQTDVPRSGALMRLSRRLRRARRDEKGATAIEFAFVAAPFLAFLFMTIEVAFVYGGTVSLEHALEKSARKIRVGSAFSNMEDFRNDVCSHVVLLSNCQSKLIVDVRTLGTFGDAGDQDVFGDYTNNNGSLEQPDPNDPGQYDTGGGGTVVLVNAFYKWDLIAQLPIFFNFRDGGYAVSPLANQSDGTRVMSATVAFKNEPFPSAGS
ncbi:MAG: TadE family protein [Pseudomonadota bacterium]